MIQIAPQALGLYIHVPFCVKKCPYCDFYSLVGSAETMENYIKCIIRQINNKSDALSRPLTSVYFGGGTPSLLGGARLSRIMAAVAPLCAPHAEVTLEANPGDDLGDFLREVRAAGVNRLSLGLQSGNDDELRILGRRHNAAQAAQAVQAAQSAGFTDISLDLMLATPKQTAQSLRSSVAFCASLGVAHVSAYLLKIEPGTPFFDEGKALHLPSDDDAADLYLLAVEELARHGYAQYEISNFAKPGREGGHNLNYWRCGEYLGLGPAAHSFLNGQRFFYPRDLAAFLRGAPPESDGAGGDFTEFAMLALRLAEGLREAAVQARFGHGIPQGVLAAARRYEPAGLTACDEQGVRFTPKGWLVSNPLLAEIL